MDTSIPVSLERHPGGAATARQRSLPAPEPLVEVRGLSLTRDKSILHGINWSVLPGERWVLLGANGSGKTSLISAIAGYMPLTRGEVRIFGEVYGKSDWRDLRRRIGLVNPFIAERVDSGATGLATVLSGRAATIDLYGRPGPTERMEAEMLLKRVGCAHLATRSWGTLSQGEQKRVLIARALMARYGILFLDEPCASLDPVARETFLGMISQIARRKKSPSIVLVTHHVEEIGPEFTHLLILKKGRVLSSGKIEDIISTKVLSSAYGARVELLEGKTPRYRLRVRGG